MFKDVKQLFLVCLGVVAVALILFIVGIVIGNIPLIIIPIAFIVLAVLGCIFLWNKAQENHDEAIKEKIAAFIKQKSELEIVEVAKEFKLSKSDATKFVYECVKDGKIDGYTLQGDFIRALHIAEMSDSDRTEKNKGDVVRCSGCGATYVDTGKYKECPYCGKVC